MLLREIAYSFKSDEELMDRVKQNTEEFTVECCLMDKIKILEDNIDIMNALINKHDRKSSKLLDTLNVIRLKAFNRHNKEKTQSL